jgi:ethanolamine transporter
MDPGIFGSILAIDMGGYQLCVDLAENPDFGHFSGIIVSSVFGCTVVFSIPVGLGFLAEEDRPYFTKGILIGLTTMPVSLLVAAVVLKMPLGYILWNSLPVLILSVLLGIGVVKKPETMMKGFLGFARFIRIMGIFGLTVGAVSYLSGITFLSGSLPLEEAMATVCSICIAMVGSMPLAELMQRLLNKPFRLINEKAGLNSASSTGLLLGLVSATPALAMIPQMNRRGQVVISAALVSCICTFGAHFAFANSLYPHMVPALLAAKLIGGICAGLLAMLATKHLKQTA